MLRVRTLCAVAVAAFIALPAYAGELSSDDITNFLAAFEEIKVEGESYEDDLNSRMADREPDPQRPFSSAVEIMDEVGFDADDIVEDHGFDDAAEWGRVGDLVMNAWMANQMRTQSPDMNAQLEMARKMLEENPDIPADQREMLMKQLEQAEGMASASGEAPTDDQLLVQEFNAEIEAAFQ
jgi:hypothetical protein